jgi:hypothetical protein
VLAPAGRTVVDGEQLDNNSTTEFPRTGEVIVSLDARFRCCVSRLRRRMICSNERRPHLIRDALKAIGKAFDDAWAEIGPALTGDLQIEGARLRLANAILSVAREDSRDAAVMKEAALRIMGERG